MKIDSAFQRSIPHPQRDYPRQRTVPTICWKPARVFVDIEKAAQVLKPIELDLDPSKRNAGSIRIETPGDFLTRSKRCQQHFARLLD